MDPKHCVSLELAKQLKEAGFPQEGEFWWVLFEGEKEYVLFYKPESWGFGRTVIDKIATPLATEIIERLPDFIINKNFLSVDIFELVKLRDSYLCKYGVIKSLQDTNLCNVLAQMWLHLKKEGLLKEK
jgi:hypothetical protein